MKKPLLWVGVAFLVVPVLCFTVGEIMGWPFLIGPLQRRIELTTGRAVRLQTTGEALTAKSALHFWGGIRLQSPMLEIGAPTWSRAPYLLMATDIDLRLRYSDMWQAYRGPSGAAVRVESLSARSLTVYLERRADGQSNWQVSPSSTSTPPPQVESLDVQQGELHYDDQPLALHMDAQLSLARGELRASTQGRWRNNVFSGTLVSDGALPWERQTAQGTPAAVKLAASVGGVSLDFEGTAQDFLHLNGIDGSFHVQGPSLAAIGEPLSVSLPTTLAVHAQGRLQRTDARWSVALQSAKVGSSQLGGDFVFDTAATPPKLSGTLNGAFLKLADLAPVVGVSATQVTRASRNRVLPARAFDLAALRAMDADVQIDIDRLDANTSLLESVRPLRAHLQLTRGLLTLTDIEARTAQGHLGGSIALDGQRNVANWVAALNWDGVQLQSWIHQQRAAGLPPYISGVLRGRAVLQGKGQSTAEILASLNGDVTARVEHGTLSHLVVELGGLDLAESLGVYFKGDNALVLTCAVADIAVNAGIMRPRLVVLDTIDSTVWVDGTLSLATEKLDLRMVVAPKDFSLLTLRSPLQVTGTFAQPGIQVEKGRLGAKLGAAAVLGLLNPLAAFIPLVDTGDTQGARAVSARCQQKK